MADDHYVAICFPLHYPVRISKVHIDDNRILDNGLYQPCAHTTYTLSIPYCQSINHFFCDVTVMLTIACIDTAVYEYSVSEHHTFPLLPFIDIAFSYGRVLLAVYRMNSAGREEEGLILPAASTSLWFLSTITLFTRRSTPQDFCYSNRGQSSGCLLHHPYPDAQSYYLQPENKGGD